MATDRCTWMLPSGIQEETERYDPLYDPALVFAMRVHNILVDAGLRASTEDREGGEG